MMKKKILGIFLCAIMALVSLTGCGTGNSSKEQDSDVSVTETVTDSKYVTNSKFDESSMKNLSGEPFLYEDGEVFEHFGFGFVLSEQMKLLAKSYQIDMNNAVTDNFQEISFISENVALEIKEYYEGTKELTEEELPAVMERVKTGTGAFAGIFRIRENDEDSRKYKDYMDKSFAYKENIATIGKDTYYFAYNDSFLEVEYSNKDKETLNSLLKEIDWFRDNLCVFPLMARPDASMSNLDVTTADGGTFTSADLAEYKLTMVNIWATWCSPCVEEMPELEKLHGKLPDGVNLISVCDDAESDLALVAEIANKTGIQYPVLVPNESLRDSLLNTVTAFPTTIFVDSEGNVVGAPIVGVPNGDVVEEYLKAIQERLEEVKNA